MAKELKFRFEQSAKAPHKLFIYDAVRAKGKFNWQTWDYDDSETSAKFFRDQLDMIPAGEEIELHVNSNGGEVSEGVTIYNLLRQKSQTGSRIIGYVDGSAYSIAMTIVMACDEIHMGLGTSMFLHNPWTVASGNAKDLRSVADQLDVLATSSRQLYLARAKNLTEEDLIEMMDKETMLDPESCLEYGFCDFVGEIIDDDPDEDPEGNPDPDDDDKDEQIRQLKKRLFTQNQLEELAARMQGGTAKNKPTIKNTLKAAFMQR